MVTFVCMSATLDIPRPAIVEEVTSALANATGGNQPTWRKAARGTAVIGLAVAKKPAELALAGARKFTAKDAAGNRHLLRNSAIAFTAAGVAAGATYVIKHWEELAEGGPQMPHVEWTPSPQT